LVGSTVLGLAAGAHLLAGGTLPALPIMAGILALHVLVTTAATKFRLTPLTMAALLASSQLVLHTAFVALSHSAHLTGAVATNGAVSHHSMSAEAHASAVLAQVSSAPAPGSMSVGLESLTHAGEMPGWMWAAHIAATLAAAALLAHGENVLWSLARWLQPLCRPAAVVLVLPAKAPRAGISPRPLPRQPWRNLRPDTRRGPPARAVVFP
jgi:hypothetical protein